VTQTASSYPSIRVYTFGNFRVERIAQQADHQPLYEPVNKEEWRSRGPAIALLKLLICRTNRRATRDTIVDALWPETDADKANRSLDVAASILRSILRIGNQKSLLMTVHASDVSVLGLPDQQQLWVDADAFEEYLTHAARAESQGADPLPFLEAAQQLAKGDFLEDDVYEEWAETRRRAIDASRHRLLHRLTNLYVQRGFIDQAEVLLQTFLIDHPTDEDALYQLMNILAQQGRRQEALSLYKKTVRILQEDQKKPSPRVRELAERIYKEPAQREKSVQIYTTSSKIHSQAVDRLIASRESHSQEDIAQYWLLATLGDLTHLLNGGWTVSDIVTSLQTTLTGLVTIPSASREHLLRLASGALLSNQLTIVDEYTTANAWELAAALSTSGAACWSTFNTSPVSSLLVSGQVQLKLLRQLHDHLPSLARPFTYSSAYRFTGAALFFQARYAEALHAHKQSYLAAVEAGDPWNMAESLCWQGGVWKACGQYQRAMEETEKALRLAKESDNPQALALQARIFAHLAECAALLQQPDMVAKHLAQSAAVLNQLEANEEFDLSAWKQYQAICAFYLGDTENAIIHFRQVFDELNPNWILQRAYTAQFLYQAYIKLHEPDEAIKAARIALPYIEASHAIMLSASFIDDMRHLQSLFPDHPEVEALAIELPQRLQLPSQTIPRFLEAKI
jgi:DNA-binding SARP family transcriptional activator